MGMGELWSPPHRDILCFVVGFEGTSQTSDIVLLLTEKEFKFVNLLKIKKKKKRMKSAV